MHKREEMGLWDTICSVGEGLKGITPDLSTVKRAGNATYHYTSAAVSKIDQVVRVDGMQKLPQYWPDDEAKAQIGLFATTLAKNTGKYAVHEGVKLIPGATVAHKLVSETMREVQRENRENQIKALQAKVARLEGKKSASRPDVINMFTKRGFVGNCMFCDLMVDYIGRMETKSE